MEHRAGRSPLAGSSQGSQHNLPHNSKNTKRLKQTHNPTDKNIRQAKHYVFDCNNPDSTSKTVHPNEEPTIATLDNSPEIIEISDDDSTDGNNEDVDTQPVHIPITNKKENIVNNTNDNPPDAAHRCNTKYLLDLITSIIYEFISGLMEKYIRNSNTKTGEETASTTHTTSKANDEDEEGTERMTPISYQMMMAKVLKNLKKKIILFNLNYPLNTILSTPGGH